MIVLRTCQIRSLIINLNFMWNVLNEKGCKITHFLTFSLYLAARACSDFAWASNCWRLTWDSFLVLRIRNNCSWRRNFSAEKIENQFAFLCFPAKTLKLLLNISVQLYTTYLVTPMSWLTYLCHHNIYKA